MLLPVKAICQQKDIRRDGTALIYIQYCFSSDKRTLLNTGIAIPPKFWSRKKECISPELPLAYGNFECLNNDLTDMLRVVEDLIARAKKAAIENIGAYVKEKFHPKLDVNSLPAEQPFAHVVPHRKRQPDFFSQVDDYIKSKERKVCPKALATFKSMKEHLAAYQKSSGTPITFSSFDFDFYEGFVDFLSFDYLLPRKKKPVQGLKINTVGKTIKQLRIFIADRAKRKIIAPIDLSDYKIPNEDTDAIYLTLEEIGRIYSADLSTCPHLAPYRDLFVLACQSGLRFSDFSTLRPENLRGDLLYKKQAKTDELVVIPMRQEAKAIFMERFTGHAPVLTNPEFNRHIKSIGKIAGITGLVTFTYKKGNQDIEITKPKHDWITTHTARRSFCSNEFLAGTPVKLIMSISGHKTEANFYRYIKVSAEEAARKVQALWMERSGACALPA